MPKLAAENIRNVALLSHSGAGKTSLAEAMLFNTGAMTRLGKVDEGNTISDYDPDEMKRKMSINLSVLPCLWKDIKINIIDTPGYADFIGEVIAGVRVADAAIITVCAASGVEVGTETTWSYADERKIPRIIVLNKMDRENADFFKTVDAIRAIFGNRCVPVQLPIGAHTSFQGLIDLVKMKSYNRQSKEEAVPAAMESQVKLWREKLEEAAAETSDQLIEKYLGGGELTQDEVAGGVRQGTKSGKIVPILVSSGLQNIGIPFVLDAIKDYLPSPKEAAPATAQNLVTQQEETLTPDPTASLSALVFKTTADPYVGKLNYFRVYSGAIYSNSQVWNVSKNGAERIGQLYVLKGKTQEAVSELFAGDIGAVAKLNITGSGDSLCAKDRPLKLAPMHYPQPLFSAAVLPKTKADLDKLGSVLPRLSEEDPTLQVHKDIDTGETILSGIGETHVDVAAEKMLRKFGVDVKLQTPKVPYKETITVSTKAEYKHKKQTGGHGQYGHVMLELEPLPAGGGVQFEGRVVGGSVPRNYIPAVEKGVREASQEGILAGFPVVDIRAILYDGSYHEVDSSDICFRIAGSYAFKKGLAQANPVLQEPIVKIKITFPEAFTGAIISDLNTKRARVLGMNPQGNFNTIEAEVPLGEVQRYAIDLRSITQGRGTFTMKFDHYEPMPAHVQKLVIEKQAEKQAQKV